MVSLKVVLGCRLKYPISLQVKTSTTALAQLSARIMMRRQLLGSFCHGHVLIEDDGFLGK